MYHEGARSYWANNGYNNDTKYVYATPVWDFVILDNLCIESTYQQYYLIYHLLY